MEEIKRIVIDIIPHKGQRYKTLGDWCIEGKELVIRVSDVGNFFYSILIALHEVIEAVLCIRSGIRQQDVDEFDIEYEKTRGSGVAPCGCKHKDEPGDDLHAPYRIQHKSALRVERYISRVLGINFWYYDKFLSKFERDGRDI